MPAAVARPAKIKLQRAVLQFYRTHARDLPWRRTTNPYRILVSEMMLQQTQVDRVIPKYRAFVARFPSLRALARASFADVLRMWVGLGYNARALRLWQCVRTLVAQKRGAVPRTADELRLLPGVGPYTSAAVSCFAFGNREAVVDTNVRRVLVRALLGRDRAAPALVHALARDALPKARASEWSQGLMDIGALFCKRNPNCAACPVSSACAYPRRKTRKGHVQQKRQPPFAGSRRFFRGRIMHALSVRPSMSIVGVHRQVKEQFGVSDRAWLSDLLRSLARDGLILLDSARGRIRLP